MPVEKCQGHSGNRNTTGDSSSGQLCMFLQSPTRARLSEGSYDKIRRQEQSRFSFCEGKLFKNLKQAQQQEPDSTTGTRINNKNLAQQELCRIDTCVDTWEISDTECDRHLTPAGVAR
ncbi:uncharacterized protein LOC111088971 [Limulus polyphemus]|uniref:Uncharacterized protein LOC111088971 n=1 Tax=Limulus polyphemus TaxID=6850 RepID=A0ABM1TJU5_LIMPO|nr:uncharacterized protein LOC111088971 [Limulus polyphemus]